MNPQLATPGTSKLLDRIRNTIHELEPAAQVILYGSQARGDSSPDSDWDILVLVEGAVTPQREAAIVHRLYDIELATDTVISAIVRGKEHWASPLARATPLHQSVAREGITL